MMKKHYFTRLIYWLLQFSWGIVQNILGLLIFVILLIKNPKRKIETFFGAILTHWAFTFSMGCGMFIFYGHENAKDRNEVKVHEYGHTIQSAVLGPLFMFVIAIPSTSWAFLPIFINYRKKTGMAYLDLYCESWANKWGEAVTKMPAPNRNR